METEYRAREADESAKSHPRCTGLRNANNEGASRASAANHGAIVQTQSLANLPCSRAWPITVTQWRTKARLRGIAPFAVLQIEATRSIAVHRDGRSRLPSIRTIRPPLATCIAIPLYCVSLQYGGLRPTSRQHPFVTADCYPRRATFRSLRLRGCKSERFLSIDDRA